jgi:glycosyltransferase involved in cell wall biosynthesis
LIHKPAVTIGICVRNRANLIGSALESIAEQDFPRELMETIIVDDGSTDNTLSVIKAQNEKLKVGAIIIKQGWNGLGFSRNVILNNSKAKYIIWVDSDNELAKNFVRLQVEFMEANANVAVAKGSYGMYPANVVSTLENIEFVSTNSKQMRDLDPNALGTGGSIYRIAALKAVGGFNERIKGSGEDAEVEYRIKRAGWKLDTTSAIFFEKRRSDWGSIWAEYFWHGKGSLQILTGQTPTTRYKFFPPYALFIETVRISVVYKAAREKLALLLPFYFVFKRSAWLLGLFHARFLDKPPVAKT